MDTTEWLALGGCAAAFVWVNWYFPWADRRGRAAAASPELRIRRVLPAHHRTRIDLPATRPGTYECTCGRALLRGHLVVEEARS